MHRIERTWDINDTDLPESSDDIPFPGIYDYNWEFKYESSDEESVIDDDSVLSIEYRTDEESIAARTVTEEDYEMESNSG